MKGTFHRDASDRLCFEVFDVDPFDYAEIVRRIVEEFELEPMSDLVVGPDHLTCQYSHGKRAIGLGWDQWSGFFVTAHSGCAEQLVRQIGLSISSESNEPDGCEE